MAPDCIINVSGAHECLVSHFGDKSVCQICYDSDISWNFTDDIRQYKLKFSFNMTTSLLNWILDLNQYSTTTVLSE